MSIWVNVACCSMELAASYCQSPVQEISLPATTTGWSAAGEDSAGVESCAVTGLASIAIIPNISATMTPPLRSIRFDTGTYPPCPGLPEHCCLHTRSMDSPSTVSYTHLRAH